MTSRPATCGSRCTGIILLLISVSLVEAQPSSLDSHSSTSGNSTILHKPRHEGSVPSSALNDGERKLPFQSSPTPSSEWINNSPAPRINKEQHLPSNQDAVETSPTPDLQPLPDIDPERVAKPAEPPKKHLIEKLIADSHTQIEDKPEVSTNSKPVPLPEFNEKDEYPDIDETERFGEKEPTTPKPKKDQDETISLINDTNVNYKGVKKERVDDVITKNSKLTQENATNVISRESDVAPKPKDPKSQVETVKNVTSTKVMRIIGPKEVGEKNDTTSPSILPELSNKPMKNISDDIHENLPEVYTDSRKLPFPENKTLGENTADTNERSSSPRGRTISFNNSNQFSNAEGKGGGSTKESAELGFTKDSRPYPYLKSSPTNPMNTSRARVSTEEISPLENTIGRSPDDKKLVVTEPSVVIDNSIQQIKPTYYKRSGNFSRPSDADGPTSPVTSSVALKTSETTESSNLTASAVLESTRDPREEILEKKNTLDENVTDVKKNTTESQESRATEANLVQNTTETPEASVETATRLVQTSITDPVLMSSPLNVTEGSTRSSPTTLEPNPQGSSPKPESSSPTTAVEETLDTTVEELGTTTLIPETVSSVTLVTERLPAKTESTNFGGRGIDSESTTSGVEYEFVGLTETTSVSYVASSEGMGTDVTEFASSLGGVSSTASTASIDSTSSIMQDSTNSENVTATSMREDDGSTTDPTTEVITITGEVLDTTIHTTSVDISETEGTTDIPEETTSVDIRTQSESGDSPDSMDSSTQSNTVAGKVNNSDVGEFSTGPSTFSSVTETETSGDSTTVGNTEGGGRGMSEQPFAPEDVNLLVRIVVEGTWNEVCPHLPALRQSLADLLTAGIEKTVAAAQIIFQKNPCTDGNPPQYSAELALPTLYLYVVDQNGNFDTAMTKILPSLYSRTSIKSQLNIRSFQLVQDTDSGNAIAVVVVSCVAFICLVLLAGLLFIMRKRQTRFNYGERCRPVSLDAFSLDSVSAYNSVRRKGANRASKRSYGNPTFEDSTAVPSHPLNFSGLSTFCNEQSAIYEEYSGIPQVSARIDELPTGAEVKNRFANVVPLPETRVPLAKINNDPLSEYINASYVRGPKNATKYYIACQAPIESTVTDFWRMIWEQQSKVIIMLTDLIENGVEKCAEYIPPSEVTDCHRLFGDYQVTLKKRETKEKYAISTLHLKNLENNTYREISHIWYLWPANGVQTDAAGLIAVLLEARALQRGGPVPIVVHCSPGTGRTGTLIALDLGIRQYEITRTVDVPRVVYTIRRDRAGAVQTKEQYAFIYKALNLYATKLAGGGIEST
ncbi:mucin-4 isoform X2 [Diachasma alloeum]|nr:mucin-4 isoform X2 [Diachasma alloeum]